MSYLRGSSFGRFLEKRTEATGLVFLIPFRFSKTLNKAQE